MLKSRYFYDGDSEKWGKYQLVRPEFKDVPELVRWDKKTSEERSQ